MYVVNPTDYQKLINKEVGAMNWEYDGVVGYIFGQPTGLEKLLR